MRIFLVLGVMSLLTACGEAEQASETAQTPALAGNSQEASVSEVNVLYVPVILQQKMLHTTLIK